MSSTTVKSSFLTLLIPTLSAAMPSLLPRQSPPPDACAYTTVKWAQWWHTTPAECTSAAQSLCGQIPSSSWAENSWTTVNSGSDDSSCRVMVYHTDDMNVPSESDCLNTFNNIISACVVSQDGKNDGGSANEGDGSSPDHIAQDQTQTVYQLGAVGYLDKNDQINTAYTGAYVSQEGAAGHFGE